MGQRIHDEDDRSVDGKLYYYGDGGRGRHKSFGAEQDGRHH